MFGKSDPERKEDEDKPDRIRQDSLDLEPEEAEQLIWVHFLKKKSKGDKNIDNGSPSKVNEGEE